MPILDNAMRRFLQAIVKDPDLATSKPEFVQIAQDFLDLDYIELEVRANYFLEKCKGGGNA